MKAQIVICEDELIISLDLKMILEKEGYHISASFRTADKVLQYVKDEKPDLVISCFKLKGVMNGLKLAEILSKDYYIKTLLITGTMVDNTLPGDGNVLVHHVKKPFSPVEILEKVEMILSGNLS